VVMRDECVHGSAAAVLGVDHQQVVLGLVHPEISLVRPNDAPAGKKVRGRGSGGGVAALSVCALLQLARQQ
jgi:hypothetical protein